MSHEAVLTSFKSNLEAALPLLKAAKVVGLIEPINPYSVPNYNMDNYEDAAQLVKDLNSPWIRLQLDVFHLQQIKGNITRNIKDLLPMVGHVQVNFPNEEHLNTCPIKDCPSAWPWRARQ